MATKYWVGDGGDWSEHAHWSLTSGGVGGETDPASDGSEDAIFDENSFTVAGQAVTLSSANNICKDFDTTAVTNNPTFGPATYATSWQSVGIWGDIKLGTCSFSGFAFEFILSNTDIATTQYIDTNGVQLKGCWLYTGYSYGGPVVLQSDLDLSGGRQENNEVFNGHLQINFSFDTGGYDIKASNVTIEDWAADPMTVEMGDSVVTLIGGDYDASSDIYWRYAEWDYSPTDPALITFDAGTSTIKFVATTGDDVNFISSDNGAAPAYYNVEVNLVGVNQTAYIGGDATFNKIKLTDSGTGNVFMFTAGETYTVSSFEASGLPDDEMVINSTPTGGAITGITVANGGDLFHSGDTVYVYQPGGMATILVSGVVGHAVSAVTVLDSYGCQVANAVDWDMGHHHHLQTGLVLNITAVSAITTTQHILTKSGGTINCYHLELHNSKATGGATWYARSSTDYINNDGWIFAEPSDPYQLDGTVTYSGVYTLGRYSKKYPMVLDLTYPISSNVFAGVEIGAIMVVGNDFYASWKVSDGATATYGVDKIDYTAKYTAASLETRLMTGNRPVFATFKDYILAYTELPTGTGYTLYYSKDYGTTWVEVTLTKDTMRKILEGENMVEATVLQLRLNATVSTNDGPALEKGIVTLI